MVSKIRISSLPKQLRQLGLYRDFGSPGNEGSFWLLGHDLGAQMMNGGKITHCAVDASFFFTDKSGQILIVWGSWGPEGDGRPVIPLAVVIMRRRTKALYLVAFRALRNWVPNFMPLTFTCDFEHAMRDAFATVFNSIFWGCIFHFLQVCVVLNCGLADSVRF
jgi:hypothetical protein